MILKLPTLKNMAFTKSLKWTIAQWAEIRWWKRYLKEKNPSEYKSWKTKYWQEFIAPILADLQLDYNSKILDVGCGPAGIFTIFDQYEVTAVDPLLDRYEQNLPYFSPKDYPYTTFVNAPLEEFHPTHKYDLVCCLNAINHVSDLDKSLDQLTDCIAPKGTLLFSIDAHNHSFFKRLFRLLPGDILHPHQYDLQEYEQMLLERGLKIEKTLHQDEGFFFDYYLILACWQ